MYANGREHFKHLTNYDIVKISFDILFKHFFKFLELLLDPILGLLISIALNILLIYTYTYIFNPNFTQDLLFNSIICLILSIPSIFFYFKYFSKLLIAIAALSPLISDLYTEENIKPTSKYFKNIQKNSKQYFKLIFALILFNVIIAHIFALIPIDAIRYVITFLLIEITSIIIPLFAFNNNDKISYYFKTSPYFTNTIAYLSSYMLCYIYIKQYNNMYNIACNKPYYTYIIL